MPRSKAIWMSDADGMVYHDACFDDDESRDGYKEVSVDDIEEGSECNACGGVFMEVEEAAAVDDDVDNEEDED